MKRKSNFLRKEPRGAPWLFSHSWEQRKLGELCFLITKGTTPLDKSNTGNINFVKIENIDSISGEINITHRISQREHDTYLRRSQLKENDILFSIAGTLGRVTSVKSDLLPANTNQALAIVRLKEGNLSYIETYLKGKAVSEFVRKNPTIGAQPNLSLEQVGQLDVSIPSEQEQLHIGAFFRAIDTLITLHQRVQCVTSLLISWEFDRFTIFWEQRKFGDIVSEYVDPVSTPTKGYYRLGIKSHAKGTFHSYVRPGMELGTAQMHRVAANNFIVNITFGWEHAVAITTEDDAGKLVSHRFPQFSFSAGMLPAYFKYLILDEDFRHHLWLASPGGAGRNRVLKISEMMEYKFWVPSQEEQQKISILLTKLDTLITLHQREFSHTKLNINYVKYYQRIRPLLYILCSVDKSV